MAYGLKYQGQYISEAGGNLREVKIYADGFEGDPTTITAMSEPQLQWSGGDKKEGGIVGLECRLTFLTTATFNAETLFHENPRHYKVLVFNVGQQVFAGWLQSDLAKDIYTYDNDRRTFSLTATDGLGDLADIDIKTPEGGIYISRESVNAFLRYSLNLTGLELNIITAVDYYDSYMSQDANSINQVTVDPRLWIEEEKTISVREVLDSFCKLFYCRLFQRLGKWHFICVDNQITATIPAYEYTAAGQQVFETTTYSHRKTIDTNPVNKTQEELDGLLVWIGDKPQKSWQRPIKRLEINYDYGPAKSEINGDFFGGSTEGWRFNDNIVHETFSLDNSIGSNGLQLTGTTKIDQLTTRGVPQYLLIADHLSTTTRFDYDEKYASVYVAVKKNETIELSFDYLAPQIRGLKICVAYVHKENSGIIKDESNIYDDLSTIGRRGLGSDGKWYDADTVSGGRQIRHLLIPNLTKDAQGNEIIKSDWENYTISSSNGVPDDGWVVLYLYRGANANAENNNATVKFRNIQLTRSEFGDQLNNTIVVLENPDLPYGDTKETISIRYGEPKNSLNYSYLARLNGARTNQQWDRTGINPSTALQALMGAMYLRQHSGYGVTLEGVVRADSLYMGDTVTLSGYADKVFLITNISSLTKQNHHNVTLVEMFSQDFEPRYYTKSGSRLTSFFGTFRNIIIPIIKYESGTSTKPLRQGVGDISGGEIIDSGNVVDDVNTEFFSAEIAPTYEYPTNDPETGEDVIHGLRFNGKGVLITDEAPTFRKVRRNYRRQPDLASGTDLDSLFIATPDNLGNFLYLNGVDVYKANLIEEMDSIPEGVTGVTYIVQDTADKFGKQSMIVVNTGDVWTRHKLDDGTKTPWTKIGSSTNIPQENVIDLVADLLELSERIFSTEETNISQNQLIANNNTQITYLAAINNQQDFAIAGLQAALNALSAQSEAYALRTQFNGGQLGAMLVKDSENNQSFVFKRAHGVRLTTTTVPQAEVGANFNFTIPPTAFIKPEFVWEDITVEFSTNPTNWVQYYYTQNGGISFFGTPTEAGVETIAVYINCNGYVSTYLFYFEAVAEITAVSNLSATIVDYYPPEIDLVWTFNGATPDSFVVSRRENGGAWVTLTITGGTTYTYTDTSANYDKTIDYKVESLTGTTYGQASNIVQVVTLPEQTLGGLYGRYYANRTLSGSPLGARTDLTVDFNWSTSEPLPTLGTQNYSVRWTGYLKFPYGGIVRFRTRSDDGIRVWVDGVSVVDEWREYSVLVGVWEFSATLAANTELPITIEYFQGAGDAEVHLEYMTTNGTWAVVPSGYLVPEIVTGGTLVAPVLTDADAVDNDTINIDWTYSGDIDNFTVQRSLTNSPNSFWVTAGIIDGADRTADINSLVEGATYFFRIRANFGGRSSDWSNVISATTTGGETTPIVTDNARAIGWMSPNFDFATFENNYGIIQRARYAGVEFATIFIDWWEIEQGDGVFNFDELKWRIEKQAENGLGFVIVLPFRFAYIPKDDNPDWRMISFANNQHRWNGSSWTTTSFSASSCAYMSYTEAVVCRDGGSMLDGILGATGSYQSATYVTKLKRLHAKIMDYIYDNHADICFGAMYADGGSTETGFPTLGKSTRYDGAVRTETQAFQDGDWSNATKTAFGAWLRSKYVTDSDFSTAWNLGSVETPEFISAFGLFYQPTVYNPNGDLGDVDYSSDTRRKDWFKFLVDRKRYAYSQVIGAVHNPSSVDGLLISPTSPIKTIAYLTESLTIGQGYTWAAAAIEMLSGFDMVWSSTGSNGRAVGSDSHYKSFALRAATLRGTIPSKRFAQELDTDTGLYSDGGRVSPSKTMAAIFAQGAQYFIVTFFRTTAEWDEANYLSEDGQIRSFRDDLALGYINHIQGKDRTLPTTTGTALEYDYDDILATNPAGYANPNGVVSTWIAQTQPTAAGLSNTYIDIIMTR